MSDTYREESDPSLNLLSSTVTSGSQQANVTKPSDLEPLDSSPHSKMPQIAEDSNSQFSIALSTELSGDPASDANPEYSGFYLWTMVITHSITAIFYGYTFVELNVLGDGLIKTHLGVSDSDYATVAGNANLSYAIGKLTGSVLCGYLLNKNWSRKGLMFWSEIFNVISLAVAFIPMGSESLDIWVFLFQRLLTGWYGGIIMSIAPRFFVETLNSEQRATATLLFALGMSFGNFFVQSSGIIFGMNLLNDYWYVFLAFPHVVQFVRFFVHVIFFNWDSLMTYKLHAIDPSKTKVYETKILKFLKKISKTKSQIKQKLNQLTTLKNAY
jgi:MFS family permease